MSAFDVQLDRFKLFDSHFHIIDKRFPLVVNNGFLPEEYTCADYLERVKSYQLVGGAVVSGSFQAFDQNYLRDALEMLGSGFVGVTQLPASVSDGELLSLHKAGVRALRFNLKRGGSEDVRHLDTLARRVHEIAGWHVELYADSAELGEVFNTLVALPSVSIDHLGLSKEGFGMLLKLVEKGTHVKATGFGRVNFDARDALIALYSANPDAVMFGTDLPCTRAPRPYIDEDYFLVIDALGEAGAEKVFSKNAASFYRKGF